MKNWWLVTESLLSTPAEGEDLRTSRAPQGSLLMLLLFLLLLLLQRRDALLLMFCTSEMFCTILAAACSIFVFRREVRLLTYPTVRSSKTVGHV